MSQAELQSLVAMLVHADIAAAMAADAEKRLIAYVAEGGTVPGYKVGQRVARERQWINESHARKVLVERGLTDELILEPPRLRSVSQIEKSYGPVKVAGLYHYPLRGVAIVPEDSPLERVEYASPNV